MKVLTILLTSRKIEEPELGRVLGRLVGPLALRNGLVYARLHLRKHPLAGESRLFVELAGCDWPIRKFQYEIVCTIRKVIHTSWELVRIGM